MSSTHGRVDRSSEVWEEMLVPGQLTHMSIYYVCFTSADLLLRFEATIMQTLLGKRLLIYTSDGNTVIYSE